MNTTDNLSPELEKKSTGLKNLISNGFPNTIEGKILYYIAVIFSLFQVGIASHLIETTGQLQLSTHVGFLGLLCFPLIALSKQKKLLLEFLRGC